MCIRDRRRAVVITNPLSEDMGIMRTLMLPSILDVTARNYNMKNETLRLYELGSVYTPVAGEKLPGERKILSAAAYDGVEDVYKRQRSFWRRAGNSRRSCCCLRSWLRRPLACA